MAQCVFCGSKAAFGKSITVGSMVFKACENCYGHFHGADDKIIVDAVRKAGFFDDSARISGWYADRKESLKEDAELLRNEIERYDRELKEKTVGICPKCGGPMFSRGGQMLMTYVGGLPTLNRSAWNTGELNVKVVVCEQCGFTEFYSSAGNTCEKMDNKRARLKEIEEELEE